MDNNISKFFHYLFHRPANLIIALLMRIAPIMPDKLYLKWLFRLNMGYCLNLDNPKTFSEKIQWLKLYNRKPEYTQMVDKFAVKEYVAKCIGKEFIIPTLGVWDKFEDIDFDALPNQFVLKTTHGGGSGGVVLCRDKSKFDVQAAKIKFNKSLRQCIYKNLKEWPYKNVPRRIIAEEFIADKGHDDLTDYKFYCFNGEPKYCQVIRDRNTIETIDFYDMKWNHMPFVGLVPVKKRTTDLVLANGNNPVPKPMCLGDMAIVCRKLSRDLPFSRIDLYVVDHKIYFGEITFFPASGFGEFTPAEWNNKLGDLLELDNK
ncbi:MAG: hypothetical protein J6V21_00305 [Alistipes sp.]|nr:hypothetical protein [Alistipes sp.]